MNSSQNIHFLHPVLPSYNEFFPKHPFPSPGPALMLLIPYLIIISSTLYYPHNTNPLQNHNSLQLVLPTYYDSLTQTQFPPPGLPIILRILLQNQNFLNPVWPSYHDSITQITISSTRSCPHTLIP